MKMAEPPVGASDAPGGDAQLDPRFSVIIPAHNESAVIGDTLRRLLQAADRGRDAEIIVVCNGCRDDTADVAREAGAGVRVIELDQGSKSLALNTGVAAAAYRPVLFMDADVRIGLDDLAAVARALREPGVLAASPAANLVTDGADPWVRAYYRTWQHHPYLQDGVGGSGVVGLSEAGLAELGRFPFFDRGRHAGPSIVPARSAAPCVSGRGGARGPLRRARAPDGRQPDRLRIAMALGR
jgi:glycosyltransferase involved in cell wall biosynthesis